MDRISLSAAFSIGPTRLAAHPNLGVTPVARAAVAAIFRDGDAGAELLFIERATKAGDPWSGQMAMPGGRVDPTDTDADHTAARETYEEVGLDLRIATRLGRLDDLHGGVRPITVSAHGYWLDGARPTLQPDHNEVADALWVSLAHLANPDHFVDYTYPGREGEIFPGIDVGRGRVVWGLTFRLLTDLFDRLGQPLGIPGPRRG